MVAPSLLCTPQQQEGRSNRTTSDSRHDAPPNAASILTQVKLSAALDARKVHLDSNPAASQGLFVQVPSSVSQQKRAVLPA